MNRTVREVQTLASGLAHEPHAISRRGHSLPLYGLALDSSRVDDGRAAWPDRRAEIERRF
jgi:hypothetical protein